MVVLHKRRLSRRTARFTKKSVCRHRDLIKAYFEKNRVCVFFRSIPLLLVLRDYLLKLAGILSHSSEGACAHLNVTPTAFSPLIFLLRVRYVSQVGREKCCTNFRCKNLNVHAVLC